MKTIRCPNLCEEDKDKPHHRSYRVYYVLASSERFVPVVCLNCTNGRVPADQAHYERLQAIEDRNYAMRHADDYRDSNIESEG